MLKAAVIGLGSMGSMLAEGFISSGRLAAQELILSTRTKAKLDEARAKWPGVQIARDNREAAGNARCIFVCVRPADVKAVLEEMLPVLAPDAHIVSIAGSVSISAIENLTGRAVTKLIPSVTQEAGAGISLVCHGSMIQPQDAAFLETLMRSLGEVMVLDERDLAMGTDLTSCMPGFIAAIFGQVVEAALRHTDTLSRGQAERMVLQTMLGTAKLMAEQNMGFEETIARVATPGGITEEGVKVLRAGLPKVFDKMFEKTLEKRRITTEKMKKVFEI